MARLGETIENPVNGERITWIETAETTVGELLSFDLALRPGATVAAEHRHLRQEERFRVLDGQINLETDGDKQIAVSFVALGDSCPTFGQAACFRAEYSSGRKDLPR
jgi:hypothetical protein